MRLDLLCKVKYFQFNYITSLLCAHNYFCRNQYIYWTDVSTKTINQAKMDGSDFRVLISTNIGTPGIPLLIHCQAMLV